MKSFASMEGLKYAAVLAAALTLGACAKNPTDMAAVDGRGGAGVGVGGAARRAPARSRISSSMSATACSSRAIPPN